MASVPQTALALQLSTWQAFPKQCLRACAAVEQCLHFCFSSPSPPHLRARGFFSPRERVAGAPAASA
eukprot:4658001-Pyramimonas_sp.AAC.1